MAKTELYEHLALQFFEEDHRHYGNLHEGLLEETHEVIVAAERGTRTEYLDELGDVLWYITVMAKQEGSTLEELMEINYQKLESRALNGKK